MHVFVRNGLLKFFPQGRIDSENADKVEGEIFEEIDKYPDHEVSFDFRDLDYISSAGLRILLRVRKREKTDLEIVNVSDTVYDVFEVTKFTDAFKISRKMRSINLDSRESVIRSLNGAIYLYGDDNMVKVFNKDVSMDEIKKERDSARAAMIAGVPTLIPFDIVTVGDNYGIIYESAGNTTLAETIRLDPGRLPDLARKFAAFLNEIHEIEADEFPDIKDRYREWLNIAGDREFAERMTVSGSKVEVTEDLSKTIQRVVAARVVEMQKHPDSDHMFVLQLDVGAEKPVQIVSGAWNLHVGDLVPAALDGSLLPNGTEIHKGMLRGVESDGMLCSLKELELTTHDYAYAEIVPAAILNDYHPLDRARPSIPADIKAGDKVYGPVKAAEILSVKRKEYGCWMVKLSLGSSEVEIMSRCSNLHAGDLVAFDTKRDAICTLSDLHAEQALRRV